jgi:predicted ATPase
MFIKRIEVRNFKSFDHLDIELGNFNLVIGANASGKSNFVQIFRFLRDIASRPLIDAISLSGGDYFLNRNIGTSQNFFLKIIIDHGTIPHIILREFIKPVKKGQIGKVEEEYKFSLKFTEKQEFEVTEEEFTLRLLVMEAHQDSTMEAVEVKHIRQENKIIRQINKPEGIEIVEEEELIPVILEREDITLKELYLLRGLLFISLFALWDRLWLGIGIYDFDPRVLKRPVPLDEVSTLKEDGSNLPLAIREILKDDKQREKFLRLVRYALPFVSEIDVARFFDQSMLLTLKEAYLKEPLPGFIISDGTANILALILALYFNLKDIIIIEEPERNIHPALIGKIVEMMKDASQNKQIIATTHNPELVKHAGSEHLLLVYRDKNGFSKITKPAERENVREFLKGEIGLDDLYVQNLLEVL